MDMVVAGAVATARALLRNACTPHHNCHPLKHASPHTHGMYTMQPSLHSPLNIDWPKKMFTSQCAMVIPRRMRQVVPSPTGLSKTTALDYS